MIKKKVDSISVKWFNDAVTDSQEWSTPSHVGKDRVWWHYNRCCAQC